MAGVDDHAETFMRRHPDGKPDEKEWGHEQTPPATLAGQDEKNPDHKTRGDMGDATVPNGKDARFIAIADRPANEIRMGLAPEIVLDHISNRG